MYIYIPKNINQKERVPLVVVIHGCTQSAEMIANETGWNKLADSLNFIVVYPEQKQINNGAKCFNYFIGFKAKKDKGEVASIKQMINYSIPIYFIDDSKIFITGMSAGGGISNAMLNAYPELFNTGVLIAAPSNLFNPNKLESKKQPKIAIIQGEKDKIVPMGNADRILDQWLKKNAINDTNYVDKKEYLNNPLLSAKYFYNNEKELKIVVLTANDVGHKVLIKPGNKITEGGKMDVHTADINFHSTYWIAAFFGLTNNR